MKNHSNFEEFRQDELQSDELPTVVGGIEFVDDILIHESIDNKECDDEAEGRFL